MKLLQLLYISQAATTMDTEHLLELLSQSYRRNAEQNITGLMMYSAGHFIQLLEGDPAAVSQTYERIRHDPRHTNLRVLLQEPTDARIFDRWRMGLLNLDQSAALDRERLMAVCGQLREGQSDARTTALNLLREFRDQLPAPVGSAAV